MKKPHVVVLGGGISGLTAAYTLQKTCEVTLIEKGERVGGWMVSEQLGDFFFERGPRSLRSSPITLDLIRELGMEEEIIMASSSAKERYLYFEKGLHPLPKSLWQAIRSPLLKGCKRAILKELFVPRGSNSDESIASFATRRFSKRVAERFFDPLTRGIYGGDIDTLSMAACFPSLWEQESRHRSLLLSPKKTGLNPIFSLRKGLASLTTALAEQFHGRLLLNQTAHKITYHEDHVTLHLDRETLTADHVFSALPAHTLGIPTATLTVVHLGYHQNVNPIEGFGYLVPTTEGEEVMGCVFDSNIFPEQNVSPDETRLTFMLRGKKSAEKALEAARRHLGINSPPDFFEARVAEDAIPQYTVGHLNYVEGIEQRLPERLTLLGNGLYGVGVNDAIARSLEVCKHPLFAKKKRGSYSDPQAPKNISTP